MSYLAEIFKNDVFILSIAVLSGLLIGQIQVKGISLGISGTLFTGLILGLIGFKVPYSYFSWNLVLFVIAVGLISAKDIVVVVRKFGLKFIILGIVATSVGAMIILLFARFLPSGMSPFLLAGSYTGALTSSPGLGAALEATNANAMVTIGYTVTYPIGVIAVVLFVQLVPSIFHIDVDHEKRELKKIFNNSPGIDTSENKIASVPFSLVSFVLCIVAGIAFGKMSINIPHLGSISLGTTGGALIIALVFGAIGNIGPFPMRMEQKTLVALRSLSLAYFLATVGLMAGPKLIETFAESGHILIGIGFSAAICSEVVTFLVGRYLFKLNWILLAGAVCGAMTSTPGLGVAIDATGGEECGSGYGATYPIALLCMVIYTKLIITVFVQG